MARQPTDASQPIRRPTGAGKSGLLAAAIVVWSAVCLVAVFGLRGGFSYVVRFDVPAPESIVDGLYESEQLPSGASFTWTGETVRLRLPGFDRRIAWTAILPVRAARPAGVVRPIVRIAVDGVPAVERPLAEDRTTLEVPIPPRDRGGLTMDVLVDPAFVPDGDGRKLGMQIAGAEFRAGGWPLPPPAAWIATAVTALFIALLTIAAGARPIAIVAALFAVALYAWLLSHGPAAFGSFPQWSMWWAAGASIAGALACWAIGRRSGASEWRDAVAVAASMLAVHGWLMNHPAMIDGDAGFHLHRFNDVRIGNYYFTSAAPGGRFPYPIALYVVALPFQRFASDGMWLLRAVCVVAHAVAGLAVFVLLRRWVGFGRAMWGMVFYYAALAGYHTLASAYLTNSFGQSMSVIAMGLAAAWPFERRRAAGIALVAFVAFVAATSHTSSFVLLVATLGLTVAMGLRRSWRDASTMPVAIATALAVVLAIAIYYAHFPDTYREMFQRPAAAAGAQNEPPPVMRFEAHQTRFEPGWPALKVRLAALPRYTARYLGWWLPALAVVGLFGWRRLPRSAASRALAAWLVTALVFFVLGHLTPIDLRYFVWAGPALGLSAALARPDPAASLSSRLAFTLAGVVVVALGVLHWLSWLGPASAGDAVPLA